MYTPVFIYSNGCVTFASSVPSGVRSMKMMTFTLSVRSHVYADLHLFEQLCSSVPNNDVFDPVVRGCVDGVVT
jgi:hypothetical protein